MVNFFSALTKIAEPIWNFLGSHPFLLIAFTTSLAIKAFFLTLFALKGLKSSKISIPLLLLLFVLIGGIVEDIAWIGRLIQKIFIPEFDVIPTFIVRIAWAFFVIRYQALALFIENLSEKKTKLRIHQLPFLFSDIE